MSSTGKRLTVVVPAAGRGARMAGVMASGDWGVPKALIECGRRPVIAEVLAQVSRALKARPFEARIVVGPDGGALRRFLRAYRPVLPRVRLRFFLQTRPTGPLGGALAARVRSGPVLLWLCDTLLEEPFLPPEDSVCTAPVAGDLSRWCLAEGAGRVERFRDKPAGLRGRGQALIGIYRLSDAALFRRAGERALRLGERLAGEFQLSAALEGYRRERGLRRAPVRRWLDAGAPDTFAKAKERFLRSLRGHRLLIDSGRAELRKVSSSPLDAEARWYRAARSLAPGLAGCLPEARLRGGALCLTYRDWPSLADWRLFRALYLPEESLACFRSFLGFLERLHRPRPSSAAVRDEANRRMLVEKTRRRLSAWSGPLGRTAFLDGERLGSWRELEPRFLRLAERHLPSRPEDWRVLHGDLVLSNVLSDGNRFFLIDPRGDYGGFAAEGDRTYDYAKLAQCLLSGYDSLERDEFALSGGGGRWRLSLPLARHPARRAWRAAFLDHCRREGVDLARLRFFEACLLLSLTPLHRESPKRAMASYLLGLRILRGLPS